MGNKLIDGKKQGTWTTYRDNGSLKSIDNYVDDLLDGECKSYFDLRFSGSEGVSGVYNYKKGVLHGDVITYYEDGSVKTKCYYQDGLLEGEHKEYLSFQRHGYNTLNKVHNYKKGLLEGESIRYFANGIIQSKKVYVDGTEKGVSKEYYEDGSLLYEYEYYLGFNGFYRKYYPNKQLWINENRVDSKREGESYHYHYNGVLKYKLIYKNDIIDCDVKEYFSTGILYREYKYVNNRIEGKEIRYYETGEILSYHSHVNGTVREYKEYYDKLNGGGLKELRNISSDYLDRYTNTYYETGELKSVIKYDEKFREDITKMYYKNGNLKRTIKIFNSKDSDTGYSFMDYLTQDYSNTGILNRDKKDATGLVEEKKKYWSPTHDDMWNSFYWTPNQRW